MNSKRRSLVAAAALAGVALVWVGVGQGRGYLAHRRLEDLNWMRTAGSGDLRETAHRALGLWLADPHDAFVVLLENGDRSSIPYLRAALARGPKADVVACTWEHGRQALSRLESRYAQ